MLLVATIATGCRSNDDPAITGPGSTSSTVPTTSIVPAGGGTIEVRAVRGDVCPSDSVPPDPKCSPRPMAGVVVTVGRGDREIARAVTGEDGSARFTVAAGVYRVAGEPVDGYRVTPRPQDITVTLGSTASVELRYDTGRQ